MDAISSLLKDFDVSNFLPELDTFMGQLTLWCRLFVLVAPLLMLGFGLKFLCWPAKTPKGIGFRSYFVTGTNESWQFAQKFGGLCWTIAGGAALLIFGILSIFFGGMEPMTMVTTGLICICVELVAVIAINVLIITRTLKFFDKDGNPK